MGSGVGQMVKTAFVFPGQGAQFVGMGKDFYDNFDWAKSMYEEANDLLGKNIARICFEGPEDELTLTENTQPAILIHSIIALKSLREHDIDAEIAAGHSLGEYSALVAAGTLEFADAVQAVQKRGQYMQEAVPVGVGAMAAIIGLKLAEVEDLCTRISSTESFVQPANMNSPIQVVVAGHKDAVEKLAEEAKKAGAKKSVLLPVSAPFHCPLMKPAEIKLKATLEEITFNDSKYPVITNVDCNAVSNGKVARDSLVRQVCSPVRWTETMAYFVDAKIERVIEFGPGKVLSGLFKRYDKSIQCIPVNDIESLNKAVSILKES